MQVVIHKQRLVVFVVVGLLLLLWWIYRLAPEADVFDESFLSSEDDNRLFVAKSHYCNFVEDNPVTGVEGIVSGAKYDLGLVQVIIRHGDRYFINHVPNYTPSNMSCLFDDSITDATPLVQGYLQSMSTEAVVQSSSPWLSQYSLSPSATLCKESKLTPTGAIQHIKNGAHLRQAYVSQWNLFSDTTPLNQQIVMRSTKWERTVQSGIALLYGLLDEFHIQNVTFEHADSNHMCIDGRVVDHCACEGLEPYIDTMSCTFGQKDPAFLGQESVRQVYKALQTLLEVDSSSMIRLAHVLDMSMVHACHGFNNTIHKNAYMPKELLVELHTAIQNNGIKNLQRKEFQRYARLKMHPLLLEMTHNIMQRIEHSSNSTSRFLLFSAHDTSLEPFAAMLGVADGSWPKYAARIVVEYYSKKDAPKTVDNSFVRFVYDGVDVTSDVRFCSDDLIVESGYCLCPFHKLQKFAFQDNLAELNSENYAQACMSDIY